MVLVEYGLSFVTTKTNKRSINLATTTTIWIEVKGGRAHMLSLSNNLEVQGGYYILPKQLKHQLASDPRGTYININQYRHL